MEKRREKKPQTYRTLYRQPTNDSAHTDRQTDSPQTAPKEPEAKKREQSDSRQRKGSSSAASSGFIRWPNEGERDTELAPNILRFFFFLFFWL